MRCSDAPFGCKSKQNQIHMPNRKASAAQEVPFSSSVREVESFNRGVGDRVRHIRTDVLGMSVADMAATFEVGTSTIQRYEAGERTPDAFFLARVAERANIDVVWLLYGGDGPTTKGAGATRPAEQSPAISCSDTLGNPVDLSEFVVVPRYSTKASAGHGSAVDGNGPLFTMAFRRYWIEKYLGAAPQDLAVLSVKGDSMEGVLNDRDVILINCADTHASAGLYVLRIDGALFVKRLQRLPGGVLQVSSANDAYEPFTVNLAEPHEDFSVIGRVVWFGRQV